MGERSRGIQVDAECGYKTDEGQPVRIVVGNATKTKNSMPISPVVVNLVRRVRESLTTNSNPRA